MEEPLDVKRTFTNILRVNILSGPLSPSWVEPRLQRAIAGLAQFEGKLWRMLNGNPPLESNDERWRTVSYEYVLREGDEECTVELYLELTRFVTHYTMSRLLQAILAALDVPLHAGDVKEVVAQAIWNSFFRELTVELPED